MLRSLCFCLLVVFLSSCSTPLPTRVVISLDASIECQEQASDQMKVEACVVKYEGACTVVISTTCLQDLSCQVAVEREHSSCLSSYPERTRKTIGYPIKKGVAI